MIFNYNLGPGGRYELEFVISSCCIYKIDYFTIFASGLASALTKMTKHAKEMSNSKEKWFMLISETKIILNFLINSFQKKQKQKNSFKPEISILNTDLGRPYLVPI